MSTLDKVPSSFESTASIPQLIHACLCRSLFQGLVLLRVEVDLLIVLVVHGSQCFVLSLFCPILVGPGSFFFFFFFVKAKPKLKNYTER